MDLEGEESLRQAIMERLREVTADTAGEITWNALSTFEVAPNQPRRLINQSGIWNPTDLSATLTIISSPYGPYADEEVEGGLLRYDYRAGSTAGQNTKLRRAMELQLPVILLRKIKPGVFLPVFPVYVIGDDPKRRQFLVALDESLRFLSNPLSPTDAERRYAARVVQQRLHQPEFRVRVINAYASRCTVCSLRHPNLLDAAHITSDREEAGVPVVPNGLSLCKIHHAAYDRDILGISPDLEVHINPRVLAEEDGPMLQHGLKDMHGRRISTPRKRADHPDRDRLDARFRRFLDSA
ncbi:MAG TPA: HNH endonuclease [Frankiaceae bacterium]|nr:HNH endonuclease [Frankiaceae bacterium]